MKRHILTVSILLVAAQLFGQESRFWVGGSGSWTDESHWSTTSGGEPGATVPESGISVVFDENSFSGARNTVSFSDAVQVGSFTATDANFALSGKKDFTVSGSINVDANVDFGKLRGALVLSGAGNKTMNLPKRLNTNIIIDGGNWTLASDLTTSGDITLMSGSFSTAGHNVNCAVFTAADSARVLNIVNSNIVCNKWQTHAAKKMTVKAMGSDIALKDNSEDNLTIGARQNYNSIHLLSAAKDVSVDFVGVKYPTCPDNSKNNPADGKMTITFDGASGPNYVVYVQYVGDYGFEAVEGVPTEGVHSDNIPLSNLKAGSYRVRYYSYPGGPKLIDQSFPLSKTPFQAASGMKQIKLTATGKAKCWGDDVEVEHNISGGAKPYHNFRWEIRKDGEDPDTIKATTVQVSPKTGVGLTITDDLGCEFVTDDMWFYYTTDDGKYEDFSDFVGPELIKADFTVEPSCEGEEIGKITITATGGTEPYKKYYYSKDGGSEKNSTSNVITELEAGNYTIRVEDKEGCDNLKNKPENILRKSVPEYDKAVAEISNDDNDYVCKTAKTYQYKATKIDTMTYKWGVTSGNENADFTGTTTGIGLSSATLSLKEGGDATIELIVTNKTCKPDTATSTLHVIKEPIPTNLSGGGEFCESELPIDISADLATGGNLVGGELELVPVPSNSPDGGTAIYDKMKITGFTKAGEYKFKVKQTDSNPKACFGISDEVITCTFYDTPIINSLTATKNTVCEGESVTITADITNEMPVTISWKKNGTTYTATTSSFDYVTSASDIPDGEVKGTVTFEVTVTNGQCDEVKKTVSVQVDKKPTPTITLDKTTLCEGTSVTATVNGRLAGSMLKWVFDETKLNSTPNDAAGTTAIGIKGTMTEEHAEYSIAVKETNGVCPVATSSEEKVTFYQLRTLSFSDDKIEGNTCAATPKELKVKTNCDVTKVAWTVTGGKGTPTTGTGETFTYTPKVATSAGTLSDSDEGKPVTISASVVSNSAVCPAPSPITFELNVKQMPRPTFVISDRNSAGFVCGLKADAEAQNTIGGTLDWSWNNTDGYSLVSKTNDKKEVELHGPNGNGRYVSVTETADGCSGTSESVFVSFRDSIKVDLPDEVDKCVSDSYVEVKATAHNATKVAWTTANSGTKTETNAPDDNEFMGTRTNTVKYVFDPSDGDVTLTVEANNEVCPAVTEDYNFTVNANPKPVLPDTTEICGPEGEIIVIVTDVNNEREWSLPEGMEKIGDDAVIDAVNKKVKQLVKLSNTNNYVEGSVVITEKNTAGCDGKDTTLVIFKALPVIEFADEDLSATICAGDTFIVHVKTHKNFTDYSWVADNGGVIQKGKDKEGKDCGIFYSYKSSTYTTTKISAAPKDGCPSDAEAKMTLTINPMPEPIINDSIICGLTYVWPKVTTVKGIGSSNGWSVLKAPEGINSSAAKVTMPFEGKWDVVVTESVDQCAARDTASITFVSKPEAFAGNDTAICASEKTFELTNATASFYDNKVADSLTWTTSGSGLFVDELGADGSHNLNPIYQITPADTAARTITLTLTAKSRTPCKATDNAVASITININPLPLPKLTGDDVICANSPSNYKTDAGMSNYVWKIGNDTIKTATSESLSNYLWTKASTYNLSVNYTDGKGCQPAKPKNMQVTVNKLPGSKLPNVDTVCTNGFITLNATDSAGTASPYIYAWSNENGASVSALLGGEDNIAMPNFASRDTGTYIMICTITDVNTCAHNDTIAVTVVPGPEAFAGDDFAVCYGDTAQLHGDYKFADGAIWTSLGDIEGKFINAADTATKFIPGPNDWKARFVKLVLTANDIRCGVATDTVKLTLHPELQVAVGTVKPFDIAASTEITVEVEGTYLGGRANDFEVYLVSPDGTEMPLMKNHITSAWTINPGTFKMKFSTKSTAIPTLKFKKEQPVDTVFGIADWSAIYGKNPAEGGWAVKIGGTYQNSGKLFGARISFTDHKDNIDTNPTKTIKFDSKVIDSRIPMKSYLTYRSPIGLNESCFGMCDAHAIANGIGGAGAGYTFTWVNDSTGVEVTPQTADGAITMLCAGDYTVTVTDGNQCSAFTSVHVGAPDKISISQDSIRNVACHGGSDGYIELSASKDLITHFDFALAGFNAASSDDTSAIFTGLPLGDYKVIVTDEDECRDSLEFSISQPDTLEITRVTVTKASSCVANNGAVTFEIKGGSGKYIMQYDGDPADQPEIVIDSLTATNIKGSNSVKFKIYDADALLNSVNCFIDTTINTARDTLIVSLSPVENLCAGDEKGSITASVSNGSGKYTYQWLDGNGNAIPDSTSSSISKLKEGTYSLYVLDTVSMCDITSNAITLTDPEPFTDTIIFTQAIKCYGDNQASFYAEAKGGTAANKSYNYTWFNVTENTEVADSVLSNVGAGKYVVTITDDNNCPIYDTITIQQPEKPLAVLSADTVKSECAVPTGKIKLNLEGGVQPYSFSWFVVNTTDIIGTADSIKDIAADIY
ncbi:MAG: SprB repeat-containing protein, partial [Salinivirgaceae bacterium]|nr:SprB repeat-containing protein [Salinivirgaceae bacterium]